MFSTHTQKYRAVILLVSMVLLVFGLAASTSNAALAAPKAGEKGSTSDYHDTWRKLWEDHITWTRVVIMGILDSLPGTGVYTGRLLDNYEDMETALKPYYGDEAEVFGDLIQDHLVIAAELLTAAHNNDAAGFADAKARWYVNANQLAVQMNKMNPQFWPLEATRQMWIGHLDATLQEATAHLTGDYAGEVAAYDMVHDMALQMADFISAGVVKQFPSAFTGVGH